MGDVVSFSKGQQINGDELMKKGRYDYLNGGINPSGCWNDFNVTGDTVTVSEGGNSCGYVNYMSYPFWCGAHCYYLYNSKLNNKYLYYALKSQQEKIMKLRTGACMPNIKKTDLGKFELYITTDINAQELTVFILDKITDLIDKRKKQLEKLDELVKSRFIEMFGGIHDSKMYPYKTVKELTEVISGGTPSRDVSEYWEEGTIPWVKTTELHNNVVTKVEEYITEKGLNNSSAKIVPVGTVLVAMYGQGKTRGMTAYLEIKACTNQACACILPSDKINQKFLWYFFILSYDNLRNLAKGGNQPNLNGNMIKTYPILYPPIELQNQFAAFVKQVDKSKFEIKQSLEKLELLKKALMQKYFG